MEHDERACPFCAETIKKAAIKCKHCGEKVPDTSPFRPVEKPAPGQEQYLLPGLCIVVGACLFFYSMSMGTTVATGFGDVSNLSLLNEQGNVKMAGAFIGLLGMFWAAMISQREAKP